MFSALIVTVILQAPTSQRLAEAKRLTDELQYDKAVKVIDAALAQPDNDRETLVGLYELAAVAWATLEKPAKAREAFQQLLSIAPDFQLSKDLPPRTRTPFFEAKTWLAGTTPVSVDVQSIIEGGKLTGLSIAVTDNALVRAKSLRVAVTPAQGAAQTLTPTLTERHATVPLVESGGTWKVEVLGDRGILAVASGEAKPWVAPVLAPEVVKKPVPEAPKVSWQQTTSFVVGAVALVSLVGGVAAGLVSSQARAQIANAERNPMGVVTGITQARAAELDATARSTGPVANVLLITGGALAAGGVLLFVLGGGFGDSPPATASLSLTPGGLVFSGSF